MKKKPKYLSKYPKPDWALRQITDEIGNVLDVCEHEIAHPNSTWQMERGLDQVFSGLHRCCGCCTKKE